MSDLVGKLPGRTDIYAHTDHDSQSDQSAPQQHRSNNSSSSLQQDSTQPASPAALPIMNTSSSTSSVTVHKYPIDKQLLLQVRLRQGRLPASMVCTPAKPIPAVLAVIGQVSPSHVGPAAIGPTHSSNTAHSSPVTYQASVYRALQLHDRDAPNAMTTSQQTGEAQQEVLAADLPRFQTLPTASLSQDAVAEDTYAAGLEQHPLADPSIHQHLPTVPGAATQAHSPPPLPIQEHRPGVTDEEPQQDSGSDLALAHQASSLLHAPPQTISVVSQETSATAAGQPVPAYAWSTDQLTAIATAAATAAAAAFQQQSAQQQNHDPSAPHLVRPAQDPSESRACSPSTQLTLSSTQPLRAPAPPNTAGLQGNRQGQTTPGLANLSSSDSLSNATRHLQEQQPDAEEPQPRRQQQRNQELQQQQAPQHRSLGKPASLKQSTALSKLKHRSSTLRASAGQLQSGKESGARVTSDQRQAVGGPPDVAPLASVSAAKYFQEHQVLMIVLLHHLPCGNRLTRLALSKLQL